MRLSAHARSFCSDALGVQRLQSLHAHFSTLQGGDTFGGGSGGGERRNGGDAPGDSSAADRFLVEVGVGTVRRIDNQLDAIGFDQVDRVGAAFLHLIYALNGQTSFFQDV